MTKRFVFTLAGSDKIGIVDRVTQIIVQYAGNVESSKMARLGGEFAMLVMVACPSDQYDSLHTKLTGLQDDGFQVIFRQTDDVQDQSYKGWLPYKITVHGADHEGIVHNITHILSKNNINIETMDTQIIHAPMSGTPLFSMVAIVLVPPEVTFKSWRDSLDILSIESNFAIDIAPYTG